MEESGRLEIIVSSEESVMPNNISKHVTRVEIDILLNPLPDVSLLPGVHVGP